MKFNSFTVNSNLAYEQTLVNSKIEKNYNKYLKFANFHHNLFKNREKCDRFATAKQFSRKLELQVDNAKSQISYNLGKRLNDTNALYKMVGGILNGVSLNLLLESFHRYLEFSNNSKFKLIKSLNTVLKTLEKSSSYEELLTELAAESRSREIIKKISKHVKLSKKITYWKYFKIRKNLNVLKHYFRNVEFCKTSKRFKSRDWQSNDKTLIQKWILEIFKALYAYDKKFVPMPNTNSLKEFTKRDSHFTTRVIKNLKSLKRGAFRRVIVNNSVNNFVDNLLITNTNNQTGLTNINTTYYISTRAIKYVSELKERFRMPKIGWSSFNNIQFLKEFKVSMAEFGIDSSFSMPKNMGVGL